MAQRHLHQRQSTPIHPNPPPIHPKTTHQSTTNPPQTHTTGPSQSTPNSTTKAPQMHATGQRDTWMRCVHIMIAVSKRTHVLNQVQYIKCRSSHFCNLSPLVTCTRSCMRSGNSLHRPSTSRCALMCSAAAFNLFPSCASDSCQGIVGCVRFNLCRIQDTAVSCSQRSPLRPG